jgi:hypothetical protein
MNDWGTVLVLCCVMPFVVLVALTFWVMWNASRYLQPDHAELQQAFENLKAKHANDTPDQLVGRIIHRQALRSGIIGAITSVGGLPTLPFGLTIDLYTSARIQSETLFFIAQVYRQNGVTPRILNLNEFLSVRLEEGGNQLLMMGGQQLSGYLIRKILVLIVEKTIVKIIPGIGLLIGFVVNYFMMQGMGRLANNWYSGKFSKIVVNQPQASNP